MYLVRVCIYCLEYYHPPARLLASLCKLALAANSKSRSRRDYFFLDAAGKIKTLRTHSGFIQTCTLKLLNRK